MFQIIKQILNINQRYTSKHNMPVFKWRVFLWRENKIQTHMALCEKVFAPHPLLNITVVYHTWVQFL